MIEGDGDDRVSLYSFKMEADEDRWRLDFVRWDGVERRGCRVVVKGVVRSVEEGGGGGSEKEGKK